MSKPGTCGWCGKSFELTEEAPPSPLDFCFVVEYAPTTPPSYVVDHLSHTGECADKLAASFKVNRALKAGS